MSLFKITFLKIRKCIPFVMIFAFVSMSFIEPVSVSVKLPKLSNIYPDTFAIYWQFDKRYPDDIKKDILVKIEVGSIYGNDRPDTYDAPDSILAIPYNTEYSYESSLVIRSRVTKTIVTARDYPPGKEFVLKVIAKKDKIEALATTNPTISSLLLLAEAYEEEECFVNAFYIYNRILSKDLAAGKTYWNEFYGRHFEEFNFTNNIQR
jgi:hypothetical protein